MLSKYLAAKVALGLVDRLRLVLKDLNSADESDSKEGRFVFGTLSRSFILHIHLYIDLALGTAYQYLGSLEAEKGETGKAVVLLSHALHVLQLNDCSEVIKHKSFQLSPRFQPLLNEWTQQITELHAQAKRDNMTVYFLPEESLEAYTLPPPSFLFSPLPFSIPPSTSSFTHEVSFKETTTS